MSASAKNSLPDALFGADAVRAIDRYVIDQQGVDGFVLMQRAAGACFRQLAASWPEPGRVLVLCGAGNNGGDGYLVAASAKRHGLEVQCIALTSPDRLGGDARKAWQAAVSGGVSVREFETLSGDELDQAFRQAGVVVDAMLGTGVSGAPREPFAGMIERCNGAAAPVLAVDLPSGLDASTGAAAGAVVQADLTVTFIGLKAGLFTGQGPGVCGRVAFDDLAVAQGAADSGQQPLALRRDWMSVRNWLPQRPANAHKGRFGYVLVVAGDHGFGGAGVMAAEAASRSGAGLVALATRPEHVTAALARCPSVMVHGLDHGSGLEPLLKAATVVVCGPGLGRSAWGQQMLELVLASGKPRVLDADALNLLASRDPVAFDQQILTPHPGEAARLLKCQVADIETDRISAACQLQKTFGGTLLLKGAGTVIATGTNPVDIVSGSNPGMATGGMGDVLSGIAGALYAQLGDPERAATLAATVHLEAACRASESKGFMGLIPGDVIDALPGVFRESEMAFSRYREKV